MTGGKQADVDTVRFVVIPDDAAAQTALLSGGIQIIPDIPTAAKKEMEAKETITLVPTATFALSGLLFQTRDPLMGKVALRRAIAASLDLNQIVAAVTEGHLPAQQLRGAHLQPVFHGRAAPGVHL